MHSAKTKLRAFPILKHLAIGLAGSSIIVGFLASSMGGATFDAASAFRLPKVEEPKNIKQYVKDGSSAIRLGKTFFWEMQVGSDGIVSCATCHHAAFVDRRTRNQLNPGPSGKFGFGGVNHEPAPRQWFQKLPLRSSWKPQRQRVSERGRDELSIQYAESPDEYVSAQRSAVSAQQLQLRLGSGWRPNSGY